jgi:hypothetical protein
MPRYYLEIPVVMKVNTVVEADSREEAINKVFHDNVRIEVKVPEDYEYVDWEWEMYERVTSGNIYHGLAHDLFIEEEDGDE